MNLRIVDNGPLIQQKFIDKFTLTYDRFRLKHQGHPILENQVKEESDYVGVLIWDKLKTGFAQIDFAKALELLRSIDGHILLMPDPNQGDTYYLTINGTKRKDCVASTDAKELAKQIEYEWYETWKVNARNMWLDDTILPEDLYVFDKAMERVIIFTHEYDFWELETTDEYMKCADSRFCLAYGFSDK